MYVAGIRDDCILGANFLSKIELEGVFTSVFGEVEVESPRELSCSRICCSREKIPLFLAKFFEKNFFDDYQKGKFAKLVKGFQEIFSDDVIAGIAPLSNIPLMLKILFLSNRPPDEFRCSCARRLRKI